MMSDVCLMIDIVDSKEYDISLRTMIQKYMIHFMRKCNQLFQSQLKYELVCSAGDEIQGVFTTLKDAWMCYRLLEALLFPVKIRGGIGVGEVNIVMPDEGSTYQDGPAYHYAREAIDHAHHSKLCQLCILPKKDVMVEVLCNHSYVLKKEHHLLQNLTYACIECMYPFVDSLDDFNTIVYQELLSLKFNYYDEWKKEKNHFISKVIQPLIIDENDYQQEKSIMIKNMSLTLSQVLNCSRQNADKLIKRSHLYQIRLMDYSTLQYLKKGEL